MTSHLRIFALILAGIFLAACGVTTDNAVGVSSGVIPDVQLFGIWKDETALGKNGSESYVFFFPQKDGGLQAVVLGNPKDNGPAHGNWMSFDILTGKVGDSRIISARLVSVDGKPLENASQGNQGYMISLYRFDADGTLRLFNLSEDATKDAIRAGRIAGSIEENTISQNTRITADPKSLDEFFAQAAPTLFNEPGAVLHRVK